MKPLDDDEFGRYVASRISDAIDYIDDEIAKNRETATKFYQGDVSEYLPSIKGRSSVVSYDVRDTVLQMLPTMLRIFGATKRAVEFIPVSAEDIEAAEQATDYCNHIFYNDNDGFGFLHSVFKDALVRTVGFGKVWWEKSVTVKAKRYEGLDDETFMAFIAEMDGDDSLTMTEHSERIGSDGLTLHDFTVEKRKEDGCAKVEPLPPEEFLIDRRAKSLSDAVLVAHRCYKRVGELAAMGYDFDDMLALSSGDEAFGVNEEYQARNPFDDLAAEDDSGDPAMRNVLYIEAYIRCDADGDGVIEWRKACCAGSAYKVLRQEMVDDHPFVAFHCEPEPHTFFGMSIADVTKDIQIIRTQIMRLGLDSLAQVVTPGYVALSNAGLDMKQVVDNRVGRIVVASRPDALTPLATDKGAPQLAFDAYRMFGEVRQDRTGTNQASMGLTPDALQSVSRIAANEIVQTGQQRTEMIARFFAEGMRRVFQLLLRIVTQYQEKERIIRLRNKFVPMNPRNWSPDMDVSINVGLGNGNVEERALFFDKILAAQQAIMQQAGPQNPWVNPEKIRATLKDAVEAANKQFERYFLSAEEWQAEQEKKAQQPPEPPKPDPAELLAQVEAQKIQASIQRDDQKTQFEAQRELLKDDRERDANEAKIIIECAKAGVDPQYVLAVMQQVRQATPSQVMQ